MGENAPVNLITANKDLVINYVNPSSLKTLKTIEHVLHHTGWNRKQAAKLLKVSYKTLLQKIRDCDLEAE